MRASPSAVFHLSITFTRDRHIHTHSLTFEEGTDLPHGQRLRLLGVASAVGNHRDVPMHVRLAQRREPPVLRADLLGWMCVLGVVG